MQGLKTQAKTTKIQPQAKLAENVEKIRSTEFVVYRGGIPREQLPELLEALGGQPTDITPVAGINIGELAQIPNSRIPNGGQFYDWLPPELTYVVKRVNNEGLSGQINQRLMGNYPHERFLGKQLALTQLPEALSQALVPLVAPTIIAAVPGIEGYTIIQPELTTPVPRDNLEELKGIVGHLLNLSIHLAVTRGIFLDLTGQQGTRTAYCLWRQKGRLTPQDLPFIVTNAGIYTPPNGTPTIRLFDSISYAFPISSAAQRRLAELLYRVQVTPQVHVIQAAIQEQAIPLSTRAQLRIITPQSMCPELLKNHK